MFQDVGENSANQNYNILVSGTTNITSTFNANAFVTKGHYYQLTEDAKESTCQIVDKNGASIKPNQDNDDTYLGVEPNTGITVITKERFLYNMQVFSDELFDNVSSEKAGLFLPLVYIKRESVWTQDQMDQRFKAMLLWIKVKRVVLGILLGTAFICLCIAAYMTQLYCKTKKYIATQYEVQIVDEMLVQELTSDQGDLLDRHQFRGRLDSSNSSDGDDPVRR